MRLIDADKIDFSEVFGGQSELARDIREAAQGYINKQPTVSDAEERWISVEERLPPEDVWDVEVTRRDGERDVAYYLGEPEKIWLKGDDIPVDVIAWKEPSEPYHPKEKKK